MSDEAAEKEFDPTPQKLLEARRKGEVIKSADLNTAAAYVGFLICLSFIFGSSIQNLADSLTGMLQMIPKSAASRDISAFGSLLRGVILDLVGDLVPIFLAPALFVMASIALQQSFTFVPDKVAMKASRISIISGIKNKFGRAGLFEFFKSSLKLTAFMVVLAVFLVFNFDRVGIAARLSPGAAMINMSTLLFEFLLLILLLSFAIGAADYFFQRAEHLRKNRMSRKDIQDELKSAEGDPEMKQRRRQKAMALASNTMLADVSDASVVIVNPTHYAVALQWDPMAGAAPKVVAKGVDEIAMQIRRAAIDNSIPIHSDPPTARSLHAGVSIGDVIAPAHYEAVAAAIRFAENIRKRRARIYG